MTIHHATLKKAEKIGVILTALEATDEVEVHFPALNRKLALPTAKQAMNIGALFVAFGTEYPNYQIRPSDTEEGLLAVYGRGDDEDWFELVHFSADDEDTNDIYIDALEAAQEHDISLEGSQPVWDVVPQKYKERYKAEGHPDNCGDWLAQFLDGKFDTKNEKGVATFDWTKFATFLTENGVDLTGKWAKLPESGQRGWQGRYRMNGRQKLEKAIAANGKLVMNGDEVKMTKVFLKSLQSKHTPKK